MLHAAIVGSGLHELVQRRIGIFLVLQAVETVSALVGYVLAVWRMIEQIERLRDLMLAFLKAERRDYQPIFDVYVMGESL